VVCLTACSKSSFLNAGRGQKIATVERFDVLAHPSGSILNQALGEFVHASRVHHKPQSTKTHTDPMVLVVGVFVLNTVLLLIVDRHTGQAVCPEWRQGQAGSVVHVDDGIVGPAVAYRNRGFDLVARNFDATVGQDLS
jgi:hypothetical protein